MFGVVKDLLVGSSGSLPAMVSKSSAVSIAEKPITPTVSCEMLGISLGYDAVSLPHGNDPRSGDETSCRTDTEQSGPMGRIALYAQSHIFLQWAHQ